MHDPDVPDWSSLELPAAWPDHLHLASWQGVKQFWREVFARKKKPVQLPHGLTHSHAIPKYALQEFHNLPNGVYSQRFSRGYITGFDISMLGQLAEVRQWIVTQLPGHSLLDLGCAGGKLAAAMANNGAGDVWGLDPCPYLLQHAQADYPHLPFITGVAENIPFANERFDGVGACFLFHEVPPKYIENALQEIARVLKPGGKVAIAEPSPIQLTQSYGALLWQYGLKGVYFKWLADFVHEPFLRSWHSFDITQAANAANMVVLSDVVGMPVRRIVLQKNKAS